MGGTGKVTIQTYKDNSYGEKESVVFTALINPTGFSLTHKVEYNTESQEGANATNSQFIKKSPQVLQLEFLFDGTGVTEPNSGNKLINKIKGKKPFSKTAVEKQLNDFYNATGDFNGTIHKPYNVIVTWGKFKFEGSLTELTIDYKLFNKDGSPLRAIGKATFLESISKDLAARMAKKSSPDLTHKRTVQDGDTLPLMTERIYGDSKYYLEVAKANGLVNFRQLIPGQELFFPPIEKVS
ncbi:LysM peptidoglycan-binding domain-containing protein [Chryseobacterium arthrosphaerae]|uniref:CIS tube protein n=1 Tax=Chryseobacterium arthrosphaerae TaxID=651561 RepID=UPI0023E0CF6D|nr:LysM peptidoglycan-binding domain-containing protein [Chryseobacterium arthrosphaerae]WES99613.1 LysM peptidoglycan-binding domain-containing protein [Chryseobacterium arthrosphaerae]